jgi:hypothetical protein
MSIEIKSSSKHIVFRLCFLIFLLNGCSVPVKKELSRADLNYANTVLLDAAMADVFTPPVASRIFAYSHLAHYISYQGASKESLPVITQHIHGLEEFQLPDTQGVDPQLAALFALSKMGKKLIYSEQYFLDLDSALIQRAKQNNYTNQEIDKSQQFASSIHNQLARWVDQDQYIQTRTYPRFTSTKKPENWRETPPDYESALEPYWDQIRPLVIDSLSIYAPRPLPEYSTDKNSTFYSMVYEVYAESRNEEKEKIAWFWDCNPVLTIHQGHMIQTIHKYSPPGHWLNIVTQVTEQNNSDYAKATQAYTYVAAAMFDAIITVWHYKFKTDLVRPITYIQEFIDPYWEPILQTPPFPEYTSGHSAISGAAATVLSGLYGAESGFHDTTQLRFGLEERSFKKFMDAANQVNLSRFYGGIHYKQGVEEGGEQGAKIGQLILNRFTY